MTNAGWRIANRHAAAMLAELHATPEPNPNHHQRRTIPMKLIPIGAGHLKIQTALPFGLRNEGGRLLLAAGQSIADGRQLAELQAAMLYADEDESKDWRRRCMLEMEARLQRNDTLQHIASVSPLEAPKPRPEPALTPQRLLDIWRNWEGDLEAIHRDLGPGPDWMERVVALQLRASRLMDRAPDASLYALIYSASHTSESYTCRHSLLCLAVLHQMTAVLQWEAPLRDSLMRAALTMNVAIRRLQDQLATSDARLTSEMRKWIDGHAALGSQLLADVGIEDPVWIAAVREHHAIGTVDTPWQELSPAQRCATLLNRVDRYTAKLSPRRTRPALTPQQAARELCLHAGGRPDLVGATLLKAVGLYPPGCIVELVGGEFAVVHSRGAGSTTPRVVILLNAEGSPVANLALRDSASKRFTIRAAVSPAMFRMTPQHALVLALR